MKIATAFAIFATSATALPAEEPAGEAAAENAASVYARNELARLESFSWDKSQPPKYQTGGEWQPVCAPIFMGNFFGSTAYQVQFWEKDSILTDRPVTTEAFYIPNVDAAGVNTGTSGPISVESSKSTTNTKTDTKGWNIGAKVTSKKELLGAVVELSGSYSETTTTTETETNTVTVKAPCKPGYECRIETWTFHLNINATVSRNLGYQLWSQPNGLLGEKQLCYMPKDLRICPQFTSRFDANCDKDGDSGLLEPIRDVHLTVPIREANGVQPMSRIVLVSELLSAKKARAESEPATVGTKDTIQRAIEKGTKFQFLN